MNSATYRLTLIHRRLDDAIRSELDRRSPGPIRLLRLRTLKLEVRQRLLGRLKCSAPGA